MTQATVTRNQPVPDSLEAMDVPTGHSLFIHPGHVQNRRYPDAWKNGTYRVQGFATTTRPDQRTVIVPDAFRSVELTVVYTPPTRRGAQFFQDIRQINGRDSHPVPIRIGGTTGTLYINEYPNEYDEGTVLVPRATRVNPRE